MDKYKCTQCGFEDHVPFEVCGRCGTTMSNYREINARGTAFTLALAVGIPAGILLSIAQGFTDEGDIVSSAITGGILFGIIGFVGAYWGKSS